MLVTLQTKNIGLSKCRMNENALLINSCSSVPLLLSLQSPDSGNRQPSEFELCALHASSAVLCCGPSFDPQLLADDGHIYQWLDALLGSHDEKVRT